MESIRRDFSQLHFHRKSPPGLSQLNSRLDSAQPSIICNPQSPRHSFHHHHHHQPSFFFLPSSSPCCCLSKSSTFTKGFFLGNDFLRCHHCVCTHHTSTLDLAEEWRTDRQAGGVEMERKLLAAAELSLVNLFPAISSNQPCM